MTMPTRDEVNLDMSNEEAMEALHHGEMVARQMIDEMDKLYEVDGELLKIVVR